MDYDFRKIEKKWQAYWAQNGTFKTKEDPSKPKFYVLDMFPYPSGAGLHVGHPLGYIASDIYSRYKRLKGFNVLHPMGYDAFGLPAEQYAIQTGQHPEVTTVNNINRYRQQMDRIGFSYDWSRELRTCDPAYYKWTQWAFLKMFGSWYDNDAQKARPIEDLIAAFEKGGSTAVNAACTEHEPFTAEQWQAYSEKEKSDALMNYRIAYQGETAVNWCAGLGTVLANDEVKDGLSVRGGFPVEQKKMKQWQLRVSAYAGRLLEGLDKIDWTDSLKEMQRNWIGKSNGCEAVFKCYNGETEHDVTIFTTRADTMFGVTFMVLAPESGLVPLLTAPDQKEAVDEYLAAVKKKTERERIAQTKTVTGVFSGSYGVNPMTGDKVPIWISEYVLAGYGTGAIMAVPAHDSRDYAFAKKFGLPIIPLIEGCDVSDESFDAKEGKMINSGFLNGLDVKEAIPAAIDYVEKHGIGHRKVNYRLRDAIFSRQRYWGEPFPVYYVDGEPHLVPESELPLELRNFGTEEELEQKVAETKTAYEDLYASYGTSTNREEYYLWQNANLKMLGAEDQLGYIRMQKNGTKIELLDDENPCEIQVFRLGGTCVIGVQGEVFVEYALYLKAVAGFGTVIFNELSNGVLPGYLYTPESLVTGGYETDTSMLAESFGRHMVEKALETIQQVK